ncbi:MAG: adenylate kinase [Planctomycetota bacterium]
MRLVFLGPPGAGKGTQAALLAAKSHVPHISTGEILRRAIELATPTGIEAKEFVERGELVPFQIMLRLVQDRLREADAKSGWILDGFPRNLDQARAFDGLLEEFRVQLDRVIYFHLSDEAVVKRLTGRRICRDCQAPYHLVFSPPQAPGVCDRCGGELYQRSDDDKEAILNRLKVYSQETNPLVAHYRERSLLETLDGDGDVAVVAAALEKALGVDA